MKPHFTSSLFSLLAVGYPEWQWLPWEFSVTPRGFWKDIENVRWYMRWLGDKLGFIEIEEWYQLESSHFQQNQGASLVAQYNNSPLSVLEAAFPDQEWYPWLFQTAPRDFWNSEKNQMRYLNWLGTRLEFTTYNNWYHISHSDLTSNNGHRLLRVHKNSPAKIVTEIFTSVCFEPWCFRYSPKHFWEEKENRLFFMSRFAKKRGIKTYQDWYSVSVLDITEEAGPALMNIFNNSPYALLCDAFPEWKWLPWEFKRPPKKFWETDMGAIHALLGYLKAQLKIENVSDWARVSIDHIRIINPSAHNAITCIGGLVTVLQMFYPEHDWEKLRDTLSTQKKSAQWILFQMVSSLYSPDVVIEEYSHPAQGWLGSKMEIDIFLPERKLAFEFQGHQHYHSSSFWGQGGDSMSRRSDRDSKKRAECRRSGITLVEVPYWWDFEQHNLQALIQEANENALVHEEHTE
eukprot:TRINITY_DN13067_c0_g1_i1.p1 TRINITY_DN13067_c0_g1~~TRINITY_DN13067_c0_g1_i1.p1  ORF type:complete len:533 (+),score=50.42 TRINITY_DN13067_c0_g1_i1:221-1600(+)